MGSAITLVTGTYNRLTYLQAMMESAHKSAGEIPIDFVIVDGGSTDGTIEWCKSRNDIQLIEQGELLGACRAFNAGFNVVHARYTLAANDDIEFKNDSIQRAYRHLEDRPACGGVAFINKPQGKDEYLSYPFGYLMMQVGLVRTWLVKLVGGWGTDYRTYAGDAEMSLKIWQLGFTVDKVEGCVILDKQPQDTLRAANEGQVDRNNDHPDNVTFYRKWSGVMLDRDEWTPLAWSGLKEKALRHQLRTLRFKIHADDSPIRTGMIDAFNELGDAQQIDQNKIMREYGGQKGLQNYANKIIREFEPDLVMFQAQSDDNITPATARYLVHHYPNTLFVNFNGDVRQRLTDFNIEMAKSVHLSLIASPDLFSEYAAGGVQNVAYWPIAYDSEFENATRSDRPEGIVFMGNHYPSAGFPLSAMRYAAIKRLRHDGLPISVYGIGWDFKAEYTADERGYNAHIYSQAALAVSISQIDLWGYSSDRLYQICATGCPALVYRFRGMEQHGFIDGETCFVWDDPAGLSRMAAELLEDPGRRERVGKASRELVTTRHCYHERIKSLLNMAEGWVT